jgi:hypothetical protein
MPDIKTLDQYVGAAKQDVNWGKVAARTTIAGGWFSMFELAGDPGAGVLAGANIAAGIIQTPAIAGYPSINAFGASAIGRLGKVTFGNTVASRLRLYDRVWLGGAYAFNAAQAVTSPSWASRVNLRNPATDTDALDYKTLEIWCEQVTAATGNQAVNVTYTNQDGTAGRTTGATGIGASQTVGRCWRLPFQTGDSGLQAITNIAGSVATVGTFNVMVLRRLWEGRVRLATDGGFHDLLACGTQVFADSAIFPLIAADSISSGLPDIDFTIANA